MICLELNKEDKQKFGENVKQFLILTFKCEKTTYKRLKCQEITKEVLHYQQKKKEKNTRDLKGLRVDSPCGTVYLRYFVDLARQGYTSALYKRPSYLDYVWHFHLQHLKLKNGNVVGRL